MRTIYHLLASSVLGAVLFYITRSLSAAAVAVLAGVFIDLDHLIDFWALKPKNPFSVKDFLNSEKNDLQAKYLFVFAHAWEWVVALWILTVLLNWPVLLLSFVLSITLHLTLDQIYNLRHYKMPKISYFITYIF